MSGVLRGMAPRQEGNIESIQKYIPEEETEQNEVMVVEKVEIEEIEQTEKEVEEKEVEEKEVEEKEVEEIEQTEKEVEQTEKEKKEEEKKRRYTNQTHQVKISEQLKEEINALKNITKTKFDYEVLELLIDSYNKNEFTPTERRKFRALTSDEF